MTTAPLWKELKVWPEYAPALEDQSKTFDFRKDDRSPPFAVGDVLRLREWVPSAPEPHYTGREWWRRVAYVARGAVIPAGFCVMSMVPIAIEATCEKLFLSKKGTLRKCGAILPCAYTDHLDETAAEPREVPLAPSPAASSSMFTDRRLLVRELEVITGDYAGQARAEREVARKINGTADSRYAQALEHRVDVLRAVAKELAGLTALEEEQARANRVHLGRHTRLAQALGLDPGYSADATVDTAIRRLEAAVVRDKELIALFEKATNRLSDTLDRLAIAYRDDSSIQQFPLDELLVWVEEQQAALRQLTTEASDV